MSASGRKRRSGPQGKQPSAKRKAAEAQPAWCAPEEFANFAVTISFSMRCDARALPDEALEAALRRVVAEFGGLEFRMGRTLVVGPTNDTLRRVLPFVLQNQGPDVFWRCFQTCKPWRQELEAQGICRKTFELCATMAAGGKIETVSTIVLQRLETSTDDVAERAVWSDANEFLQRSWGWRASLQKWLQAASQEPAASSFSRGAAATAKVLGLPLVRWVGKPEGKFPGTRTLKGHSFDVNALAFSSDGTRIVTGSYDHLVKVWNVSTGAEVWSSTSGIHRCRNGCTCTRQEIMEGAFKGRMEIVRNPACELSGHRVYVRSVAFSPDGRLVVSGGGDNVVKVWDATTGAGVWTSPGYHDGKNGCICGESGPLNLACPMTNGHTRTVFSVAFSTSGKLVVSGSNDCLVKIWNAATGAQVRTLGHTCSGSCICTTEKQYYCDSHLAVNLECPVKGHLDTVFSAKFSPDDTRVVSGSGDNLVKIWDAATGAEVWSSRTHDGKDGCICSHVLRYHYGVREVLYTRNPECPIVVSGHMAPVRTVAFSPDGTRVVSGSDDRLVKIWDSVTGAEVLTMGHTCAGSCICTVCRSLRYPQVQVKIECLTKGHTRAVFSAEFSPDGERIVTGSGDKLVKVWNAATGAEVFTLTGHAGEVYSVAFSPDGKRIASGSLDTLVKIWDASTRAEVCTARGHSAEVHFMAFSFDGARVCTLRSLSGRVACLALSPDGKRFVTGSGKTLTIWDAAGTEVWTLDFRVQEVLSVDFSRDGKRIVSGSEGGLVKIWNAANGAVVGTLPGHSGEVNSVAFSPDGKHIASGSPDTLVKIWDARTRAAVHTLGHTCSGLCICTNLAVNPECPRSGHERGVTVVAFTDDSAHVVSGSFDCTVRFWDVASGLEVRQVATLAFAFAAYRPGGPHQDFLNPHFLKSSGDSHLLESSGDTLVITQLLPREGAEDEDGVQPAVACFKAPQHITFVRRHGASICVGCAGGAVCILQAPFLT